MAAATPSYPWHAHAPRLGTASEFSAFRSLLTDANYSDEGIRQRLDIETLEKYSAPLENPRAIETPLDALIRLFFDCAFVAEVELDRALPPGTMALLDSLGLIVRDHARPGVVFASAAILPAFGMLTVCDRGENAPDGSKTELPPDVVYPAILDTTRRFIESLPTTPCDSMLDIGTGTGIAAMLGAQVAREAWATDITPRATVFAEFNARLAGLDNLHVAMGDMYQPVEGKTFDRITIHPPYVPAKTTKFVFRDAGADGEQIIRRAVEGVPRHLRPGGRFYSVQLATDREGEMFEERIRKWLGPDEAEFDVLVGAHSLRTPSEFLADAAAKTAGDSEQRNFLELWRETKTRILVYGAVIIERHAEKRQSITKRVQAGHTFDGRHQAWLLDWYQLLTRPEHVEMLMAARPFVSPDCELHVVSRVRDGRFRMEEFNLKSSEPFRGSFKCDGPVAHVITNSNGTETWRERFDRGKSQELIPPGLGETDFAGLLGLLVSIGILRIPEYLPPPPGRSDKEAVEEG